MKLVVGGAGLLAVLLVINAAGSGVSRVTGTLSGPPTLVAESAPADAGKAWVVTKVWQGSGNRDLDDVTVGSHWRVDWIYSPAQAGGGIQVFIFHADSRTLMNLAANTTKGGADSSFWSGAGKFFLRVAASGDWKVAVQELR